MVWYDWIWLIPSSNQTWPDSDREVPCFAALAYVFRVDPRLINAICWARWRVFYSFLARCGLTRTVSVSASVPKLHKLKSLNRKVIELNRIHVLNVLNVAISIVQQYQLAPVGPGAFDAALASHVSRVLEESWLDQPRHRHRCRRVQHRGANIQG